LNQKPATKCIKKSLASQNDTASTTQNNNVHTHPLFKNQIFTNVEASVSAEVEGVLMFIVRRLKGRADASDDRTVENAAWTDKVTVGIC